MRKNNKGFTLAELLIVVAIIAVLVAIAIPIFTNQLEKSREATDLANLRSVYAEIATGMLTNDMDQSGHSMNVLTGLTAQNTKVTPATDSANGTIEITVSSFPVAQKVANWQTEVRNVAGFQITDATNCPSGTTSTVKYTFTITGDTTYLSGISFASGTTPAGS